VSKRSGGRSAGCTRGRFGLVTVIREASKAHNGFRWEGRPGSWGVAGMMMMMMITFNG
jgi:hypothetical protein